MQKFCHQIFFVEDRPRILGLTASVVNDSTKPDKLERKMKELELALSATIETTSDLTSVAQYGAKPKISVIACQDFVDPTHMTKICRNFLMEVVRFCERANFNAELELDPCKTPIDVFNKVLSVLAQLGPWCAWKVAKTLEKRVTRSQQFAMTDWQVS